VALAEPPPNQGSAKAERVRTNPDRISTNAKSTVSATRIVDIAFAMPTTTATFFLFFGGQNRHRKKVVKRNSIKIQLADF
jgi:hypothetical protein